MLSIKEKIKQDVIREIDSGKLKTQQNEYFEKHIKSKWQKFYSRLNKRSNCFYPNCKNQTIKNSHSISKNNCLNYIADKGLVITPEFNLFEKEIKFQKKGIGNSSTYPGFCETHEQIFSGFENVQNINESSLVLFQSYRILCREIFLYQKLIDKSKSLMKFYSDELNKEAKSFASTKMREHDIGLDESFEVKVHNKIFDEMSNSENEHSDYLEKLKKLKKKFDLEINEKNKGTNLLIKGIKFNGQLPITLGGCNQIKISDNAESIILIMNVIPQKDSTYVFYMAEYKNQNLFQKLVNITFDETFHIIEFIEFFMINCTDNWFYNPSKWESLPKWKKKHLKQMCVPKYKNSFVKLLFNILEF